MPWGLQGWGAILLALTSASLGRLGLNPFFIGLLHLLVKSPILSSSSSLHRRNRPLEGVGLILVGSRFIAQSAILGHAVRLQWKRFVRGVLSNPLTFPIFEHTVLLTATAGTLSEGFDFN